jgi:site-specific DNA-methyltransferase (adenine-specific)
VNVVTLVLNGERRWGVAVGDCVESLRAIPDSCVHCCVTSPPYWGLRDYGHDGQIGLESTPEAYVARMVEVFRQVRRVLRDDGTLWLNLGDSYANKGARDSSAVGGFTGERIRAGAKGIMDSRPREIPDGLKAKDLVGIPWRVAFALQADGWYLRQDIIWNKPNPMPESVQDRCTKAHEYVFLLTKSERYFYDADAVSEALSGKPHAPGNKCSADGGHLRNDFGTDAMQRVWGASGRRNRRSVWTITTKPYTGAHFAVMPPDLVEPCIKAGCPEDGTVLDPFGGSGTVGAVAVKLNRNAMLIELNAEYVKLARERVERSRLPMFDEEF